MKFAVQFNIKDSEDQEKNREELLENNIEAIEADSGFFLKKKKPKLEDTY